MNEVPARIAEKYRIELSGCWTWLAATNDKGYGRVFAYGKNQRAHRVIYEILVGPIPKGLTCDHLCRNRLCVNPTHIELVDNKTNILRGVSVGAINAKKTHCIRGHLLVPRPVPTENQKRFCPVCIGKKSV